MGGVDVLVLQHDATDPPLRLGDWLAEAGATLHVRRLFADDAVPVDPTAFAAIVCLGGEMNCQDDAAAPWLPATRTLLAAAVGRRVPVLGVCLGAQLLAVATGGSVQPGDHGPEMGAYLVAKRDAALTDPLFAELPMTPDVMHCHDDVVTALPPGAILLLSSTPYANQAFRVGGSGWGIQFHIEAGAAELRAWAVAGGRSVTGRLGPMLDAAEAEMAVVWRDFTHRFIGFAAAGPAPVGRRLDIAPTTRAARGSSAGDRG